MWKARNGVFLVAERYGKLDRLFSIPALSQQRSLWAKRANGNFSYLEIMQTRNTKSRHSTSMGCLSVIIKGSPPEVGSEMLITPPLMGIAGSGVRLFHYGRGANHLNSKASFEEIAALDERNDDEKSRPFPKSSTKLPKADGDSSVVRHSTLSRNQNATNELVSTRPSFAVRGASKNSRRALRRTALEDRPDVTRKFRRLFSG